MENQKVEIFENQEFGTVRTVTEGETVLFCGSDVAQALGYSNHRDALSRHCRCVVKHDVPHPQNPNKSIEMSFISEGDIYRLIAHSKLPSAEKFERWVFDEVLPTIRKHGMYMTPETLTETLARPENLIVILEQLKVEQEKTAALRKRTEELTTANYALAGEIEEWDSRSIVNALVRAYASAVCGCDFLKAWNLFYKKLEYKLHCNVRARKLKKGDKSYLDTLTPRELDKALGVAAAMCEFAHLDIGKIIGEKNAEKVGMAA